ncbi:T9SS type B sorting domain-containing protein [Capnocytophaga stomatis]|uniref:T9SS type B sorting domain-containing protein n=1 Tax=Capnocytophaga stomatis TaxID=1848904 RepID=A0ABW8QAD3_9FLAO
MRLVISFLLSISVWFVANAQVTPTVSISDHNGNTNTIEIDCDYNFVQNKSITLTANYPTIYQTQDYDVVSITYAPVAPFSAGTVVKIESDLGKKDDVFSKALSLPFEFCFYGNQFQEVVISDNGVVSFGAGNSNGDSPYTIAGQNPNLGLTKNAIFGVYHDLQNVDKVRTLTQGTAPYRQFIINYDDIPQYGSLRRSTTQIVLYETTGVIEVYVKDKPQNDATNITEFRKQALIGIINADGTKGVTPPNRNTGIWSATQEAWRFVPSGTTTINVEWYNADNQTYLGSGNTITRAPTINTRYEVRVTYNLCSPITVKDLVQVSFSTDFPTAKDVERTYCLDLGSTQMVNLTSFQTAINSDITLTFSYHETETQAHNNQSPIANPNNYSLTSDKTIYVRTLRSGICYTVSRINLRTNIRPKITTPTTPFDFCDERNDLRENINLNNVNIPGVNYLHNRAFFENLADAQNNANAIVAVSNYQLNVSLPNREKTLYVRVWNHNFNDASCATVFPIRLHLKPYIEATPHEALICQVVEGQAIKRDLTQYVSNLVSGTLTYNLNNVKATFYRNSSYFNPITNPTEALVIMNATIYVKLEYPNFCESRTVLKLTADFDCDGAPGGDGGGGGGAGGGGGVSARCDVIFPINVNLQTEYFPHYLPTGLTPANVTILGFYDDAAMTSSIATPTHYELTEDNTPKTVYVKYRTNAGGVETSLNFTVNASEKRTLPKDTFKICDVQNDGREEVPLVPEYRKILEDLYPFSNPSVRFFLTDKNRGLYITSSPKDESLATESVEVSGTQTTTVYALVSLEGCHYEYDLRFLLEKINVPEVPLTICDFNDDKQEIVDLVRYKSDIDAKLTADQRSSTTTVSYYYSERDAHTATNPIADETQAQVKTGQMSVFARVEFTEGCFVIVHLRFGFTTAVDLPTVTTLNVCDILNDGTESVDLSKSISGANASSTISFFNNEAAADANDSNFLYGVYSPSQTVSITLTTASTTVYVRVLDAVTNCKKVLPLSVNLISFPKIANNQVAVCDFANDGKEEVLLTEVKAQLVANNSTTLDDSMDFSLYFSQADALSATASQTTVTATQNFTAWVRITPAGTDCFYVKDVEFSLVSSPKVQNLNKTICNNSSRNLSGNTSETVNLNAYREEIIGRTLTLDDNFRFFTNENDALSGTNEIGTNYTITSFPIVIYVRTENNTTKCYSVSSITFNEHPQLAVSDTSIAFCADGQLNGNINLTEYPAKMVSDTTIYDVTYHESHANAVNDIPITSDITNYYVIPTSVVWMKFVSKDTGCFVIKRLAVSIYPSPKVNPVFQSRCDTDLSGTFTEDLTQYVTQIITGEPNVDLLYTFTYHTTLVDAQNGTNAVVSPTAYKFSYNDFQPNPSAPNQLRHSVFVRVVANGGIGCASQSVINFDAFLKPTTNTRTTTLTLCDDNSDDGLQTFDLTQAQNAISTQIGVAFTFYPTYVDAQNQTNAIANPAAYTNTKPYSETVFTRFGASGFCDDWAAINLVVYPYIQATDRVVNTVCEFDNNGNRITINLPQEADAMLLTQHSAQSSITITFHDSQADAENGNSPITNNLANYDFPVGQKVVWVRFTNVEGCSEVRSLTLEKVANPAVTDVEIEVCDVRWDNSFTQNLKDFESRITNNTSVTFRYFKNSNDARNGLNELNPMHSFTRSDFSLAPSGKQTYEVVASVTSNNPNVCLSLATIRFVLPNVVQINTRTTTLTLCDDNSNDGLQTFDLTQAQNAISTQTGVAFTFYPTYVDAQNQTNAIADPTAYTNTKPYSETVFARFGASGFCDDWAAINLVVYPYIQAADRVVNTVCEFDNNGNRITINLPQEADAMLLTQHSAQSSITITFHDSQADAENGNSPITNNLANYDFPVGQKVVWVRFTNIEGCSEVRSLKLEKVANPAVTDVNLTLCDDDADGVYPLDLNALDNQVTTSVGVTVTYYQSENEARTGTNLISKTGVYNVPPHRSSRLYARIENANGCISIAKISLVTIPSLKGSISILESCENNVGSSLVAISFENRLNFANIRYAVNSTDIAQSMAFDRFEDKIGYIETSRLPEKTAISLTIFYETCQYTLPETFNISHLQPLSVVEVPQQDIALVAVEASGGRTPYEYIFNGKSYDTPTYVMKYSDPGYVDAQGRTVKQVNVVVRDALGCEVTLDIEKVFVDFNVPNFFTPDNDGNNDRWSPKNTKSYPRMITQIFDRHGRLIKTLREGESWDGTYNGTSLPSGDYWYSIETNEPRDGRKFVGNFTLMR